MTSQEFRNLHGNHKKEPSVMTAEQWRKSMKKKSSKPKADHVKDIRIMLQLARVEFVEEHRFHPKRKWKFDFAIPDRMIAIEYEGIFAGKSRHTTISGYMGDAEKYNEAAKLGWRVLRYTAKTFKNVVADLENFLT